MKVYSTYHHRNIFNIRQYQHIHVMRSLYILNSLQRLLFCIKVNILTQSIYNRLDYHIYYT